MGVLETHHVLQFLPLCQQRTAVETEVGGDTCRHLGLWCSQVILLVSLGCHGPNGAQIAAVPLQSLPRVFLKGCILCLRFSPSTAGLPGCSLHVLQWYCSSLQSRHPCCPTYRPTASSWLEPRRQLPQTGTTFTQDLHREPVPFWGLPGADFCSLHQHLGCGCH